MNNTISQDAGVVLLDASYGLESVTSALMSSHTKSRIVAIEVTTSCVLVINFIIYV